MIPENKDIRITNSIREIVDCIDKNTYGDSPLELLTFYSSLPNVACSNKITCSCK